MEIAVSKQAGLVSLQEAKIRGELNCEGAYHGTPEE